jgi:hypothetical protein
MDMNNCPGDRALAFRIAFNVGISVIKLSYPQTICLSKSSADFNIFMPLQSLFWEFFQRVYYPDVKIHANPQRAYFC